MKFYGRLFRRQVGLESAAAQQYNDKRGLIESFDTAAERYLVKVPSPPGRWPRRSTTGHSRML